MELRANGGNVPAKQIDHAHHRAARQQGRQVARQTNPQTRPDNQRAQRDNADGGIAGINGRQRHRQRADFLQIMFRHVRHLQTEKIFNLHGTDGDTDPGGEAEGDR